MGEESEGSCGDIVGEGMDDRLDHIVIPLFGSTKDQHSHRLAICPFRTVIAGGNV